MSGLTKFLTWIETADQSITFVLIGMIVISFLFGWFVAKITSVRRIAILETMLENEMESASRSLNAVNDQFKQMSSEALQQNNQHFIELAQHSFRQFQQQAANTHQEREKAVKDMVSPIKEALDEAAKQLGEFDIQRRESHRELSTQIKLMSEQSVHLQSETQNLVQALRRPEVRGQWGEITLKRLVELSGLVEHSDFSEQATVQTDEGLLRPDMIIRLPGSREIVIDVKTPLDAYLSAHSTTDEEKQKSLLLQHASQMNKRISELASKKYWAQFSQSPDFVILFIPGDQFLSSALSLDPQLLDKALRQKVIPATPSSLVALLRIIAYGWKQETFNQEARNIRDIAEQFHHRLATFSEHFSGLGNSLEQSIMHFNKSIGSYRRQVMPIAKRFAELGLEKSKSVKEPEEIQEQPRT